MTVGEIIKAVRFCYDEEALDNANFNNASAQDNTYMDNIIKSKIGDAVRWICLYSPAELLGGSDETSPAIPTGILVDVDSPTITAAYDGKAGKITLAGDFIKLARVRVADWHRAVKEPWAEDSEEYLQLLDSNGATATYDRPQAAIIDKATKELEVWPWSTGKSVSLTYVADVNTSISSSSAATDKVALPPRVKTAFIYYLAFLVLSAYEDSRAARMLEIAKMNIGK